MPYLSLPHLLLSATVATAPAAGTSTDAPTRSPTSDAAPRPPKKTTPPQTEPARSAAARAHYGARRYREAAQIYEQLHRDTGSAKYLFNAGMARAAAEHDGAAVLHWQTYLAVAPAVTAAERKMLEGEITAAKRRTRAIQLRLEGPLAPATLTLTAPDDASQGPRDPIDLVPAATIDLSLEAGSWTATLARPDRPDVTASFRVAADAEPIITLAEPSAATPTPPTSEPTYVDTTPATLTLRFAPRRAAARGISLALDGPEHTTRRVRERAISLLLPPGDWSVQASARDRDPASASITLGPGDTQRMQLQLPRSRDSKVRLGLGLGLGATGLGLLTAGAAVAANAPHKGLLCSDAETCTATANALLDRSIGFSLLGAGIGVAAPALTAGLGRTARTTDRALIAEAGVGGVLLVGGVAWYFAEVTRTTALDGTPRQHAAAIVRGLGGGLLGSAVVSLVVRRLTRGKPTPVSVAPTFSPHLRGLALQAQF